VYNYAFLLPYGLFSICRLLCWIWSSCRSKPHQQSPAVLFGARCVHSWSRFKFSCWVLLVTCAALKEHVGFLLWTVNCSALCKWFGRRPWRFVVAMPMVKEHVYAHSDADTHRPLPHVFRSQYTLWPVAFLILRMEFVWLCHIQWQDKLLTTLCFRRSLQCYVTAIQFLVLVGTKGDSLRPLSYSL
jgi:hypothetical protein